MSESEVDQRESFNTDQQYIAGVYAKSLIDAAEKAGNTEEVLEQLDSFVVDVLGGIPKMAAAFDSIRVSEADKSKLIDSSIGGKADKTLVHFLKVLNRHGRLDCIRAINRSAKIQFNELKGRVEAFVTVADDLSESLEGEIKQKLKTMLGKEVILNVSKDSAIIGGMIVKVGDTVYDSSVANQLQQLRETTMDRTMQKVRSSFDSFAVESDNENN